MTDTRTINGKVHTVQDSKERVAYELMIRISNTEANIAASGGRAYWLTLYEQCLEVVVGRDAEHALRNWKRP